MGCLPATLLRLPGGRCRKAGRGKDKPLGGDMRESAEPGEFQLRETVLSKSYWTFRRIER